MFLFLNKMINVAYSVYTHCRNNNNIGRKMLKIRFAVGFGFCFIVCVGYLTHLNIQKKKQQEVLQIIKDANQSMHVVKSNPYNHHLLIQNN